MIPNENAVHPSPDLMRKWKEADANYRGLAEKYDKVMRGEATVEDIKSMDTLTSAASNRIISCMTMLVREAREAAASTAASKTGAAAVLDGLYYGCTPADTRTVRRCWFCGVPLPRPLEVPKSAENRYVIACNSCTRLIDKAAPDAPYGMFRECECGHELGDHHYDDDETEEPSPCDECGCKDWKEKAGE